MIAISLCLGGSEESMKKRIEALKTVGYGHFVLTGFESEILFMKSLISKEDIAGYAYSYDTLSNFARCSKALHDADTIVLATSPLHWERVKLILSRKFPELLGKVRWVDSHEGEAGYAELGLLIYKILGPWVLQKVAILTRWKRFKREYRIPRMRDCFD